MAKDDSTQPKEGITRRSLLRRGAILGGSLLWTTPIVQSITPPASAKISPNGVCSCCACNDPVFPGGSRCVVDNFDPAGCAVACGAGGVASFCQNVTPLGTCTCTSSPVGQPICVCG